MKGAVHELLEKSERSINAANLLLSDGYYIEYTKGDHLENEI